MTASVTSSLPQYEALSQCAETTQTSRGFRIELDSKKFKAGNESEVNEIGKVLSRFPQDRVSVQVYSGSEPIKDAEKVRDQLIEKGVSPEQISLSGLTQDQPPGQLGNPMTMWLEIESQA